MRRRSKPLRGNFTPPLFPCKIFPSLFFREIVLRHWGGGRVGGILIGLFAEAAGDCFFFLLFRRRLLHDGLDRIFLHLLFFSPLFLGETGDCKISRVVKRLCSEMQKNTFVKAIFLSFLPFSI